MRIKDWEKTFEQGRKSDRVKKGLTWVTLPCGKPSAGIAVLSKYGIEGQQAFSVFIQLVQLAATFDARQRGTFPDDYTDEVFATLLFIDLAAFENAANLLVKVGWIEGRAESGGIRRDLAEYGGKASLEERKGKKRKGKEIKGKEKKKRQTGLTEYPNAFAEFWNVYPRRVNKKAALVAWEKATKETPASQIIRAAEVYATSDIAAANEYVPHPATWLNKGAFLDDPKEWERREPKSKEQKRQEANFGVLANVSKMIDQQQGVTNGQGNIHATISDNPKRISHATERRGRF
jgi:hypothetical protein